MDSQTNTDGGAAIQGDANVQGNLIGRDQTINNIVILSNFLHFTQVEDLFPEIQQMESFSSLTEAVESALGTRLDSDLAVATAFTGEIIGDFIATQIPSDPREPISLKTFVSKLINHIGRRLGETGHWNAYSQSIYGFHNVLWLEATIMLWNKQFPNKKRDSIFVNYGNETSDSQFSYFFRMGRDDYLAMLNTRELRVIIAGLVLDLIRIGSDAIFTTEYLKCIVEQLSPAQK